MKLKHVKQPRILATIAVLLVLFGLAGWKIATGIQHFSGETSPTPSETGENTADLQTPSYPNYTSAALDTTDITCLSLEVGAYADEIRFNWLSPSSAQGEVRLTCADTGETLNADAETFASTTVSGYYVNKASVSGLQAGATYTYQVGNEDALSPEYSFRIPAESDTLTFLVTADAQIGQAEMELPAQTAERWDGVLTGLTELVPDASFLFHLGDQVADFGSQEHYKLFLEHQSLYQIPLAPVTGNHDVANDYSIEANGHPGGQYFYEHFNVPNRSSMGQSQYDQDGNYYFIRDGVLFIVLNSSTSQGSEVQEQYVAQIVAEHPDTKWRILAQHFPAYTGAVNSHTDCKEYLARIAAANDIDLILGAHDHSYSRTAFVNEACETLAGYDYSVGGTAVNPEGTLYITCSTSSGCLYRELEAEDRIVYQNQPHVPVALRFDVTDTELHMQAYTADTWTVFDEYTIQKD